MNKCFFECAGDFCNHDDSFSRILLDTVGSEKHTRMQQRVPGMFSSRQVGLESMYQACTALNALPKLPNTAISLLQNPAALFKRRLEKTTYQ